MRLRTWPANGPDFAIPDLYQNRLRDLRRAETELLKRERIVPQVSLQPEAARCRKLVSSRVPESRRRYLLDGEPMLLVGNIADKVDKYRLRIAMLRVINSGNAVRLLFNRIGDEIEQPLHGPVSLEDDVVVDVRASRAHASRDHSVPDLQLDHLADIQRAEALQAHRDVVVRNIKGSPPRTGRRKLRRIAALIDGKHGGGRITLRRSRSCGRRRPSPIRAARNRNQRDHSNSRNDYPQIPITHNVASPRRQAISPHI